MPRARKGKALVTFVDIIRNEAVITIHRLAVGMHRHGGTNKV